MRSRAPQLPTAAPTPGSERPTDKKQINDGAQVGSGRSRSDRASRTRSLTRDSNTQAERAPACAGPDKCGVVNSAQTEREGEGDGRGANCDPCGGVTLFVRKPHPRTAGRQALRERPRQDLETLRTNRNANPKSQAGTLWMPWSLCRAGYWDGFKAAFDTPSCSATLGSVGPSPAGGEKLPFAWYPFEDVSAPVVEGHA